MGALGAIVIIVGSVGPGMAASFNSVVETVLSKQPQVTDLPADRQRAMIACVKKVLSDVPAAKQRHVAASANFSQMEDRFGELVLEDHAKLKQKITSDCGSIAMQ
jgi:hypothetical protein